MLPEKNINVTTENKHKGPFVTFFLQMKTNGKRRLVQKEVPFKNTPFRIKTSFPRRATLSVLSPITNTAYPTLQNPNLR